MRRRRAFGGVLAVWALVVPSDWQVLTATGGSVGADNTDTKVWSFFATVWVDDDEHRRVTLRSAELVGVRGLQVLGVMAYGSERSWRLMSANYEYPPRDYTTHRVPVDGAQVRPGLNGIAFAFGVTGEGSASGFAVTYEMGGRRYRQVFDAPVYVCPPEPPTTSLNPASNDSCRTSSW